MFLMCFLICKCKSPCINVLAPGALSSCVLVQHCVALAQHGTKCISTTGGFVCRPTDGEELRALIEGARYQLKLLPNKSLSLWLVFTAGKEASFNFVLPISLLGYGFSVAGTFDSTSCCTFHHLMVYSLPQVLHQQVLFGRFEGSGQSTMRGLESIDLEDACSECHHVASMLMPAHHDHA